MLLGFLDLKTQQNAAYGCCVLVLGCVLLRNAASENAAKRSFRSSKAAKRSKTQRRYFGLRGAHTHWKYHGSQLHLTPLAYFSLVCCAILAS